MSGSDLRAEYARIEKQAAEALDGPAEEARLRELLDRFRTVTRGYDQQLLEAQARIAEAEARIAELTREVFGPKADRLTPEQQEQLKQVLLDLEDESQRPAPDSANVLDEEKDEDKADQKRRKRRRRTRHPLPDNIETETVTLEPELDLCPCCGKMPGRIGEEVTEEIDVVPARLIRRRIVRPKYACPCGEAGVTVAALPSRLIPQSKLGLGLAAYIVLARFDDHLSYYRLAQQFLERHGVEIPRQQMVQWVEHIAAWLQPLVERMWQAMAASGYLQVDETPVKALDPEVKGKAAQGYLWFYAAPGGDVFLEFDTSRGLEPVRRRLSGFSGTIQTDAYEVYAALSRKESAIARIGCLAHSRRYMYKALKENFADAVWFIGQIRLLYKIEDNIRSLSASERHAARALKAPEIWKALKARAVELQPALLPKSTMGKAVNYFLNEYDALTGYLADGRFEIDNNLIENAIRPTAVGRKRWLFIGHPDAGWRSAVISSLLGSCRRRGINPHDYLTDVLGRLPGATIGELDSMLPANWKPRPG